MPVPPYRSLLPEGLGIFPQEEDQLRADPGYPQETGPCGFQLLWCQVLLHYVAFLCLRRGRAGTPKQGCRHLSSQALGPQEPLDPILCSSWEDISSIPAQSLSEVKGCLWGQKPAPARLPNLLTIVTEGAVCTCQSLSPSDPARSGPAFDVKY